MWSAGFVALAAVMGSLVPAEAAAEGPVVVLQLDESIQPASRRYLERGLAEATKRNAELVVLELNTPGGVLVSLREMTGAITSAAPPVAVYVTPAGARAASAGFFLLLASDFAAMAPGTNAGAAHPVALGKPGRVAEQQVQPEEQKAVNDTAALARSLADRRSRPVGLAEQAVRNSRAFSAREARDAGLIDAIASSRAELLEKMEGRTLRRFDGRETRLASISTDVQVVRPSGSERLLMTIADPVIAYLLLMLGLGALLVELLHPGAIVPGVVGAVALLLALYAFSVLPVNFVGVALLAAALAFFVAEAFVTSYGLLAAAGLTCFVLGSLMLFDTAGEGIRLSLAVVLPVALVIAAIVLILLTRVLKAHRAPSRTGVEALIGTEAEVVVPLDPAGTVLAHGEYWDAVAPAALSRGARVRIVGVSGRRLKVARVEETSWSARAPAETGGTT